jgi:cytochrome c-type biogenesis protein CcmH/NrfG
VLGVCVVLCALGPTQSVAQLADRADLQRYYLEAETALAEKRLDAAAQAYETLTRLDSGTAENYAQLGLVRYMQGSFADALGAFRKALKLKPGLPHVDVLLAICLSELGHFTERLTEVLVKSVVAWPTDNIRLAAGQYEVHGFAWTGAGLVHSFAFSPLTSRSMALGCRSWR